ncbi:hypothetical protein, partial [Mesorhizobium sp. M2A.F.Ca.ET.029.05.1.1]|uniref:hypothetical protein n=1 Tax=Mesorhizobium sp. M2A.F.Ca.ET.029.05.1.1 TaxID=2496658 RepID=UPI001AEC73A3
RPMKNSGPPIRRRPGNPGAERFPDILSEIAGGPTALIHVGLHETGEDPTKERKAPMKGSNRVCLLSAHRRLAVGVAKGGRILERRSGDPFLDGPAGKRQPDF